MPSSPFAFIIIIFFRNIDLLLSHSFFKLANSRGSDELSVQVPTSLINLSSENWGRPLTP